MRVVSIDENLYVFIALVKIFVTRYIYFFGTPKQKKLDNMKIEPYYEECFHITSISSKYKITSIVVSCSMMFNHMPKVQNFEHSFNGCVLFNDVQSQILKVNHNFKRQDYDV